MPRNLNEVENMVHNVLRCFEETLCDKQLTFEIVHSSSPNMKKVGYLTEWPVYELILYHLIGNAVKYSKTGGNIQILFAL